MSKRMTLVDNGTITFQMPGKGDNDNLDVTLRIPILDELYVFWGAVDEMSAGVEVDENGAVKGRPVVETMKMNAAWVRTVVATIGEPSLYRKVKGEFVFSSDVVEEPAWFVNGTIAAMWLRHWQSAPLAPGSSPNLQAV